MGQIKICGGLLYFAIKNANQAIHRVPKPLRCYGFVTGDGGR